MRLRDKNGHFIKNQYPKIPVLCECGCNEVVWGGKRFIRGHIRYWKGKKRYKETIEKMSICMKGKRVGNKHPMFGKQMSQEAKDKRSVNPNYIATRKLTSKGKKASPELREKLSKIHKGLQAKEKHPLWKIDRELYHLQRMMFLREQNSKRRREMEYNLLNRYALNMAGHHLDFKNVVFIPLLPHRKNPHKQKDNASMLKINMFAWDYLEASAY